MVLVVLLGCTEGPTKFIGAHEPPDLAESSTASTSSGTAGTTGTTGSTATLGGSQGSTSGAPVTGNCEVGSVPSNLNAPTLYTKYADAVGIPVLSAALVSDAAVTTACQVVQNMLALRADVTREMIDNGARVAVMAPSQSLRDLPELANISSEWNNTRGIGAAVGQPLTVAAEENLLCLEGDVYQGEVILVHSFAHAMRSLGIARLEADFDTRLEALYDAALFEGKWLDAFSSDSFPQYWAEGVQTWFDVNLYPPNQYHNEINTRVELESYDPGLYNFIAEYLPAGEAGVDCF